MTKIQQSIFDGLDITHTAQPNTEATHCATYANDLKLSLVIEWGGRGVFIHFWDIAFHRSIFAYSS